MDLQKWAIIVLAIKNLNREIHVGLIQNEILPISVSKRNLRQIFRLNQRALRVIEKTRECRILIDG